MDRGNQYRFSHGDILECDDQCGTCATHDLYMWWCGNDNNQSEPVGSKLSNPYGLHDMHGNLYEWVEDWWDCHLGYDPQTNPTGPSTGSYRVVRGGPWYNSARYCRSAYRYIYTPYFYGYAVGFRLARSE